MDIALFFLIPPQISATTNFFFPPIFGDGIATIATNVFFPYFGNGIATIVTKFFFPYFGNSIATIDFRSVGLGNRNFGNVITEIQNFLSPTFSLSLSYFC